MAKRKQTSRSAQKLFADDQGNLFEKSYEEQLKAELNRPVECLGMTFENDEKRREYFLEKLREKQAKRHRYEENRHEIRQLDEVAQRCAAGEKTQ